MKLLSSDAFVYFPLLDSEFTVGSHHFPCDCISFIMGIKCIIIFVMFFLFLLNLSDDRERERGSRSCLLNLPPGRRVSWKQPWMLVRKLPHISGYSSLRLLLLLLLLKLVVWFIASLNMLAVYCHHVTLFSWQYHFLNDATQWPGRKQ